MTLPAPKNLMPRHAHRTADEISAQAEFCHDCGEAITPGGCIHAYKKGGCLHPQQHAHELT